MVTTTPRYDRWLCKASRFVLQTIRALGVEEGDVEDASQKVMMVASRKVASITPGNEDGFLYAIARGVAANTRRSYRVRNRAFGKLSPLIRDEAPNPEETAVQSEAQRLLMCKALEAGSQSTIPDSGPPMPP